MVSKRGVPSEAQQRRFLEALAETCNVTLSAKAANLSSSVVYRRRQRDASFRMRWGEALATGYAQLEMAMLERALVGRSKEIRVDGESQVIRDYDDRIGIALLKMHRDTVREVEAVADGSEVDEAAERILMRLRRLRSQLTGEVEVKQGIDRIELLAMALRMGVDRRGRCAVRSRCVGDPDHIDPIGRCDGFFDGRYVPFGERAGACCAGYRAVDRRRKASRLDRAVTPRDPHHQRIGSSS